MSRKSGGSPPSIRPPILDDEDNVNTDRDDPKYRRASVPDNISQGATPEFRHVSTSKGNPLHYSDNPEETLSSSLEDMPHWSFLQPSPRKIEGSLFLSPISNSGNRFPLIGIGPPCPSTEDCEMEEFFSPFAGGSVGDGPDDDLVEETTQGSIRAMYLPRTFRLERTNFVVQGPNESRPKLDELRSALEASLGSLGVDVLDFRGDDCVHECSYQRGNVFLSLWLRIFLPPPASSGQLYSVERDVVEQNALLVEVQLREGDRLCFSAIFRDLMTTFKDEDNGMDIKGTYRYHLRRSPATGEGLMLEKPNFSRPRPGYTPLSMRRESHEEAVPQSMPMRRARNEPMGKFLQSSLPLPSEKFARPGDDEDLDEDAVEDITSLANMLGGQFVDMQSDAAGALAGITADENLLRSLSMPKSASLASTLCSAAACLLTSTWHRPARRQGAVLVANLSATQPLRAALLAGSSSCRYSIETSQGSGTHVGLIQFLVAKVMGKVEDRCHDKSSEEEIGTRRECMRALVNFSTSALIRNDPAIVSLLSRQPAGRGGSDPVLQARLEKCRDLLKNKIPSSSP